MRSIMVTVSSPLIEQTRQAAEPAGPTTTTGGVLGRPDRRDFTLTRVLPAEDLSWCVERHWQVAWDLPAGRRAVSQVLPHPCVNVVFDRGELMVAGIGREVFSYPLSGSGRVYGVKFRPAGFRPFFGADLTELGVQTLPASLVWAGADELAAALRAASGFDERIRLTEEFLRGLDVPPDPVVEQLSHTVFALLTDPTVQRVTDVCGLLGVEQRTLQRLFRSYVGVTPHWVLKRGRLHSAAERIAEQATAPDPLPWARVAAELGYADQAHFIRDFRAAVGETPARYAARLAAEGPAYCRSSRRSSTSSRGTHDW
jgi:AraC-like DNA-binding protein